MNKILLFIVIVLAVVAATLILINLASKNTQTQSNQLAALSPSAQPTKAPTPLPSLPADQIPTETQAVIKTSQGDISLQLFPKDAPRTVKNFVEKARSGYYKNLTFHRVEDWVIQGGDPKGNGTGGGPLPTELNTKSFKKGALGVARGGNIAISNDSQFFIVKTDATWLDKQYTNFGQVTNGMDVVNKIKIGDKILDVTVQ